MTEVPGSTVREVVTIADAAADVRAALTAAAVAAPGLAAPRAAGPVVATGSMRITAGGALAIDTQGAVPQRLLAAAAPRISDSLYLRPMLRPARAVPITALVPTVRESTVASSMSGLRALPARPRSARLDHTPPAVRAREVVTRPDAVAERRLAPLAVASRAAVTAEPSEAGRITSAVVSARLASSRPADRVLMSSVPAVSSVPGLRVASGSVARAVGAAPPVPTVRWRASLNLPEIRAAALSSAVHRPPPDSVPIDDERRTTALSRSELEPAKRRRGERGR